MTDFSLYTAAKVADDEYQAALVKEYGPKRASAMRYVGPHTSEEVKAARKKYIDAVNLWLDEMAKTDPQGYQSRYEK
jgi:hypothetical protein